MLRLTHVFIVIFCTYVIFNFYVSTTVVVSPPLPSFSFNCMNNLWYEQNHYFQRKYPSFEPPDILKHFATSFILILLLFTLFLHLCNSVSFISFSTNLTLNRKKKDSSGRGLLKYTGRQLPFDDENSIGPILFFL